MPRNLIQRRHIYNACENKRDTSPERHVDESILKEIATNFRTLPIFEKNIYERVRMKHFSLQNNEKLNCCWQQYKKNIETKRLEPFVFPKIRDLHYYRNAVEFRPSENKWEFDNRRKLNAGPGVDAFGQKPIPQELLMKRSGDNKDSLNKKKKNASNQTK